MKVVALLTDSISENRGTPIRIRQILHQIARFNQLAVYLPINYSLTPDLNFTRLSPKEVGDAVLEADIIYICGNNGIRFLVKNFKVRNALILIDLHSLSFHEISWTTPFLKLQEYLSCLIMRYKLKNHTHIIVATNKRIIASYSHAVSGIVLNGIDNFQAPELSSSEGSSSSQLKIGYVGNGRKYQGIDSLRHAVALINSKPKNREVTLSLVTSENVNFLDRKPWEILLPGMNPKGVREFIHSMDLMVIPRLSGQIAKNSLPVKALEYLSSGTVVVLSDAIVLGDSFLQANVISYKAGSVGSLAANLTQLLEDPAFFTSVKNQYQSIASYVNSKYSWDIQGELLQKFMENHAK
jgi:glycosyltransferase involved in cell wall biosynthesis